MTSESAWGKASRASANVHQSFILCFFQLVWSGYFKTGQSVLVWVIPCGCFVAPILGHTRFYRRPADRHLIMVKASSFQAQGIHKEALQ